MLLPVLGACSGPQSALAPAGEEARQVAELFWGMVIAGAVIWMVVIGLLLYAQLRRGEPLPERLAGRTVILGGALTPALLLMLLLTYALWLMPALRPFGEAQGAGARQIEISGEQFWWRIRYPQEFGLPAFETANELRLPLGDATDFTIVATDVIHSFWIPALGGKMDAIPGRTNRLSLRPTRTGVFRAPCAEFCGQSHALMALTVEVMEPEAYRAWRLARAEERPGAELTADAGDETGPAAGRRLFAETGCSGCHAANADPAAARTGPNLARFGERRTIGAGTLVNTEDNLVAFIRKPQVFKPGVRMPGFAMLPDRELRAIARFLMGEK